MGNVIEKSFKEIWENEDVGSSKKVKEIVNVNKDYESNCRQHYINRFLSHEGLQKLMR